MLLHSNKPQVLRLQNLEQRERQKFSGDFMATLAEVLPTAIHRKMGSSPFLSQLATALPDLYYTLTTLLLRKRRLGEQSTYTAMQKEKHFKEEGVVLNKKTRLLLFVLEMVGRNLFLPLFGKLMDPQSKDLEKTGSVEKKKILLGLREVIRRVKEGVFKWLGSAQEIMSNVEWMILMVYMLGWNKHFTFLETLLGISYVYTYKNDQIREVSYAVEGYLLLTTFIIKALKLVYSSYIAYRSKKPLDEPLQLEAPFKRLPSNVAGLKQKPLCRICYDELKEKSSTKCGHVFCWSCIVQSLEMSSECPVCRTACLPREVVQLRNG